MNLPGSADPVQSLAECAESLQQNYLISRTAEAQLAFILQYSNTYEREMKL